MNELRFYLEMLLDHQCGADKANCPECVSLARIYQFMENELFSTVIYTETPIQPRPPLEGVPGPLNRVSRHG